MKTYTPCNSDMYIKVYKIYHINKEKNYVKLKASIHYKSDDQICQWLCPRMKAKSFKILYNVFEHWKTYER